MADSLPILVLMAIMFRLGSTLPIEPEKGKAYDHLLTTTPVPEKDLWWQRLLEEPCAYIQENWADSDTLDPHHKILPREAKEDHHKPDFHYKKIIKVLNKTAQSVGKLLEHYTENRFGSSLLIDELDSIKLHGMPQPKSRPVIEHNIQADEVINTTYPKLAKVLIYLDRVQRDEVDYDEFDEKTKSSISYILHKLFPRILCHIHTILSSLNYNIEKSVVDKMITLEIRDIHNRALRHIRDFIVFRDSKTLLEDQKVDFILLDLDATKQDDLPAHPLH